MQRKIIIYNDRDQHLLNMYTMINNYSSDIFQQLKKIISTMCVWIKFTFPLSKLLFKDEPNFLRETNEWNILRPD